MRNFVCAAVLLPALFGAVAQAQGSPPSSPPAPELVPPKPDDPQKPSPELPSTGEDLSKRLDRSEGVIRPPSDVDPEMNVAPKDPGAGSSMPVIPPPGSPGGNPRIQPK